MSLPEQSGTYWLILQANAGGYLYEADTTNNTLIDATPVTVSYQVVPPDLAPLSVVAASSRLDFAPASPQAPTVSVVCVVTNRGRGAATGGWYDSVSISTSDGANPNSFVSVQTFSANPPSAGLLPGESYRETNLVSLPEQSGTYWLVFQVNAYGYLYETNLANNVMVGSVPVKLSCQVVPPDLVPLSLAAASNHVAFSAFSPQSQPTVPVVWAVMNQGLGAASGYWYDTVSVSTNGTTNGIVSSQDLYEDWSSVPLPPDGVYQETNYVTLPAQSGTYWLILQVNNYNYLYEARATNDTLIAPLPVTVTTQLTPPDLAPVSVAALSNRVAFYPSSPGASPAIAVAYTVTNLGPETAFGEWADTVSVSTNGTADGIVASQDFYEDWESPGLAPGETYQRTNAVTLPAQNGTYWLIFQANDDTGLYEADTMNNTLTSSVPVSVTLYAVTPPDLAPLKLAALTNHVVFHSPDPQSPPSVPVVYAVTNEGGTAFGNWVDVVSISTNASLSGIVASQNFYESWTSPDLPPGGTYQRTNEVTLPAQSGKYWLIFQADAFNYGWLGVTDMTNNTLISSAPVTLTYTIAPPDLAPVSVKLLTTNLSYHPLEPESPAVAVRCVVRNQGTGPASGAWYDCVYVSTNLTTKGAISSQLFPQQWTDPALAPGDEYVATNYVWLPQRSGKYWLIFQANDYAQLYEPDTANNTMVASAPVTLTYSLSGAPGRATGKLLTSNHAVSGASSTLDVEIKAGYLPAQGVQLQGRGLPAYQRYVVLSATDLTANAIWVPVATNTAAADGTWSFTDTNDFHQAARFYRAVVSSP